VSALALAILVSRAARRICSADVGVNASRFSITTALAAIPHACRCGGEDPTASIRRCTPLLSDDELRARPHAVEAGRAWPTRCQTTTAQTLCPAAVRALYRAGRLVGLRCRERWHGVIPRPADNPAPGPGPWEPQPGGASRRVALPAIRRDKESNDQTGVTESRSTLIKDRSPVPGAGSGPHRLRVADCSAAHRRVPRRQPNGTDGQSAQPNRGAVVR
jgi:hypothetical protein